MKVVSENQNGIMNTLSLYFPSQLCFCLINKRKSFRGTQRRFPRTYALKILFRLSRELLHLQKCILSSSKKIVSVRSSQGKLNLFEITSEGFSIILPKILDIIQSFAKVRIFFLVTLSIAFSNTKILGFLFLRKLNSLRQVEKCENSTSENRRKLLGKLYETKLHLNGTVIQKFLASLKVQKSLDNFCFSEQIFYRKLSLGAPGHCEMLRL